MSISLFEVFHLGALVPYSKDGSLRLNVMHWLTVGAIWKHKNVRWAVYLDRSGIRHFFQFCIHCAKKQSSNGVKLSTKFRPCNGTEVQIGMSVYILLLIKSAHTDFPGDLSSV